MADIRFAWMTADGDKHARSRTAAAVARSMEVMAQADAMLASLRWRELREAPPAA
jgi:hypothetical protein